MSMFPSRLNCRRQNILSLLLLSSGCLPPPLILFPLSLSLLSSYEEGRGKPSWPFLQLHHPSTSNFNIPPPPYFFPPTLLLPIRSRESLSNNTLHLHIHTHIHTHTVRHMHREILFTPASFVHTHTFIFCALHFKHMKGCSAGTKAKGRVGSKEIGGGGEGGGDGVEASLREKCIGETRGPKGGRA